MKKINTKVIKTAAAGALAGLTLFFFSMVRSDATSSINTGPVENVPTISKPEIINLTKQNTIVLRSVVTDSSIAKLQVEMFDKASKLSANDTIYLILDTPGGSVPAGEAFIDSVKGLKVKVATITLFAASMGFQISQNLDTRYVVSFGTYMSHRMTVEGLGGQIPGSAVVRVHSLISQANRLDSSAAARMGLTLRSYQRLIADEFWVSGDEAVSAKVADAVIAISCGVDLQGTTDEKIKTMFGDVAVTYSDCPAIRSPLKIDLSGLTVKSDSSEYRSIERLVVTLTRNKRTFVENYIINKEFMSLLR